MNIIDRLTTAQYSAEKFRILTFMWMPRHPYRSIPPPMALTHPRNTPPSRTLCAATQLEQPEEHDKEVMCRKNEDPWGAVGMRGSLCLKPCLGGLYGSKNIHMSPSATPMLTHNSDHFTRRTLYCSLDQFPPPHVSVLLMYIYISMGLMYFKRFTTALYFLWGQM